MSRPKLAILVATPLTLHFFFRPHLEALTEVFDVTVAYNPRHDTYLPPIGLPLHEVAIPMERRISIFADIVSLWHLWRLFRRERFDIVVSVVPKAGLLGTVAGWLAGVSCRVHIFQGEVWASRRGMSRRLLKSMDWLTACLATDLLAVSPSERNFLEAEGVVAHGRVGVLGAGSIKGVDLERYRPDEAVRAEVRRAFGIPDDAIVCIFLGRLARDKGVVDLARAFRDCAPSCPDLWLLFCGPDEEKRAQEVRAVVGEAAAGRLVIAGYTAESERLLAASDFLALPSYREGFGMVIIEAAAAGIPAIGTRIYGISDAIVDGETGILVPPASCHSLGLAMRRFAMDAGVRQAMGSSARTRVRRDFEQSQVVARYVGYLKSLIERTIGPA